MEYSQPASACQPKARHLVDTWLALIERLLYAPTCVLCGAPVQTERGQADRDLCAGCEQDLPRNSPACANCAQPLPSPLAEVCGACLKRPPRFHGAWVPYRYRDPLDHLIRGLKYRGRASYGRVLGDLLAQHITQSHGEPWPALLVPVPLGQRRYRERGYNQSIELALRVAKATGIPLRTDLIERTRETAEQATLDRKARKKNVRNAFRVCGALPAKHIAILDDVLTTGSTANEVARVLRRAGAKRVELWAVARAAR